MFNNSSSHRNARSWERWTLCRMIGVKLFRRLALPRRDGPSLAAKFRLWAALGNFAQDTTGHSSVKLASLVAACCCSVTLCVLRSLARYKAEPRPHVPDLQLSVLVSSKVLLKTWLIGSSCSCLWLKNSRKSSRFQLRSPYLVSRSPWRLPRRLECGKGTSLRVARRTGRKNC